MIEPAPLIDIQGLVKQLGGTEHLRVRSLRVRASDRLVVSGFDRLAAETFLHLVSGAAVPDAGTVKVSGVDTRLIATDTEWLVSLDRFGMVTHRAVLLDSLSVAANLALPLTLAIEPMAAETRATVDALAASVDLGASELDGPVGAVGPLSRARVHLARALANRPELLLLEDPTRDLTDRSSREAFGRTLRTVSAARPIGWLALSDDADFARASGGVVMTAHRESGHFHRKRAFGWWPWGGGQRGA